MKYRHEIKININSFDKAMLSSRLSHIMQRDKCSGSNGSYIVRSIYFDDFTDTALYDKLIGVRYREKYRIRIYNNSTDLIKLEKKIKINDVGYKNSTWLTEEECRSILTGDFYFLKNRPQMLCRQLYSKMRTRLFKPKTIVQYDREAYIWNPGMVRITIDSNIQTGLNSINFLSFDTPLTGVMDNNLSVLEIKYDDFLPAHISDLLQMNRRQKAAISKYVVSRRFG